VKGPCD